MDSQSVASGPEAGRRGVGGGEKVERHVLPCWLRFALAVWVMAANLHDMAAADPPGDRAAAGRIGRDEGGGLSLGARPAPATAPHRIEIRVSKGDKDAEGFASLTA